MSRDANETIIRLDHDLKTAEVWTPNRRVQSTMRRVGAEKLERQIEGQWWRVPYRIAGRSITFGKSSKKGRFKLGSGIPLLSVSE